MVAHMHVETRNGPVTMGTLYVNVTGSANPNADFPMVRVFDDTNNDGLVTAGEEQVGAQVMAVTGTSFVTLSEAISTPRNFVVTVDIADTLAAGTTIPGAPWSLLAIAVIPIVVLYRRRRLALGVAFVALVVGAVYACGSGGGGDQDTDDDQQQADNDATDEDTDNAGGDGAGGDSGGGDNGGGDFDPPPGAATFEFAIQGVTTTSGTITEGFPIDGAAISVER